MEPILKKNSLVLNLFMTEILFLIRYAKKMYDGPQLTLKTSNHKMILIFTLSGEDPLNPSFITNPVDAYKLITRFVEGWDKFDQLKRSKFQSDNMKKYAEFMENSPTFHDDTEQWGAIYAIIKLQETYQMEVRGWTSLSINFRA